MAFALRRAHHASCHDPDSAHVTDRALREIRKNSRTGEFRQVECQARLRKARSQAGLNRGQEEAAVSHERAKRGGGEIPAMTQNIYDDPKFFEGYSRLPRSVAGLDGAPEWPALRALIPNLQGCSVVDLGCG